MKTLLLTFLTMGFQLVLFTHSIENDSKAYCTYAGDLGIYNYVFNITDVQEELQICGVFSYSAYYFDGDPPMTPDEEDAIDELVENKKVVYIGIDYAIDYREWAELLNPPDNHVRYNTLVENLVIFLKKHKISGVIMRRLFLYDLDSPATAQNVAIFATALKAKMNNKLKVGLSIIGDDYQWFTNSTAFDYGVTNSVIDHYFIDMTVSNYCTGTTKHDTINPIKSNNSDLFTLEEQSISVNASAMDKSKIVAELQVDTILSSQFIPIDVPGIVYGSYSELCAFTKNTDIIQWCSDYTTTLYHQGKFATKYYRGIMLSVMEGDDTYGACHCGPFIVSKAIMSGWKSETEPKCEKLDDLMKIT